MRQNERFDMKAENADRLVGRESLVKQTVLAETEGQLYEVMIVLSPYLVILFDLVLLVLSRMSSS